MTNSPDNVGLSGKELAGPITGAERIDALDTLRGFAVLGILILNIVVMAFPVSVMFSPVALGPISTTDLYAWIASDLLAEGAFRTLFSMMFGAGTILITERLTARYSLKKARGIFYRRTFWLLMLGLLDTYVLLWFGDILFVYALSGALIYLFRNLKPRTLMIIAAGLIAVLLVLRLTVFAPPDITRAQIDEVAALHEAGEELSEEQQKIFGLTKNPFLDLQMPTEESTALEIEQRTGSLGDLARWNAKMAAMFETFAVFGILDAGIMMLLGMAFYRWGIITGTRPRAFYLRMALIGYGAGFVLNVFEVWVRLAGDFSPRSMSAASATYDLGRLALACGHLAVIMLLCQSSTLQRLQRGLAAAGRMALSNYLMQSVLGVVVFWGLGLFNQVTRPEMLLVMLGIWLFQLWFSVHWLEAFRFGPAEWLWRSLTYWRSQPMWRPSTG